MGLVVGTHAAAALAPVTAGFSIILVPIFALAGIFSGNTLSYKFKMWLHGDEYRRALREWESARATFNSYCTGLAQTFKREYPTIQRILHAKHRSNLAGMRERWRKSSDFVRRYVYPSELSMGLRHVIRESKREFRTITIPYYEKLLMEVEGLGGVRAGTLVFNQGRPRLLGIPELERRYDRIPGAVREAERMADVLEEEKRKLEEKL